MRQPPLVAAALAEFVATAFLLIAIVGSGISAQRLFGDNAGLALLANAVATGGALFALIVAFGRVSGAHMNPVVTLAAALLKSFTWRRVLIYVVAQMAGGIAGVIVAHGMFDLPLIQVGVHARAGVGQWLAEIVATMGLLLVIHGSLTRGLAVTAASVACYITGAYWFTASTAFANPAVTVARSMTATFSGIRPGDAPGFIVAQVIALVLAIPLLSALSTESHP
jgi:glycerol uptake facilitator-like aquaporin